MLKPDVKYEKGNNGGKILQKFSRCNSPENMPFPGKSPPKPRGKNFLKILQVVSGKSFFAKIFAKYIFQNFKISINLKFSSQISRIEVGFFPLRFPVLWLGFFLWDFPYCGWSFSSELSRIVVGCFP